MDSNYVSPLWLKQLLQECENEFADQTWPIKLLGKEGRKAVWAVSTILGANSKGIPAQACRLLERYLAVRCQEAGPLLTNLEERERFKQMLSSQLTVIIAACVQLASKMSCAATALSPKVLQFCLLRRGILCTVKDINRTELQVFDKLGCKIPLFTSVDCAELLAVEVGLPLCILRDIGLLVNIAEYHRDLLDQIVKDTVKLPASTMFNYTSLRTLHLAAGAVAAGARHFGHATVKPVSKLAKLTRAPVVYIKCIASVLLNDILRQDSDEPVPCKKRKV
ncbi:uncharacterized protein LOC128683033 [Plodia interpunctella]|uniref:uncharacterized protein LOC128683033 n=1 Tax=Plodia interpunctella TaxID=58824 RepID=UPI0023685740|nr:uncharacterized protein LOC128683033 [Plodia interpunctella]